MNLALDKYTVMMILILVGQIIFAGLGYFWSNMQVANLEKAFQKEKAKNFEFLQKFQVQMTMAIEMTYQNTMQEGDQEKETPRKGNKSFE